MKLIDGNLYRQMLAGGVKALEINRPVIDELNVFPVPDGDTGTNMSLTITSAMREAAMVAGNDIGEIAIAFSKGALKGARGNSGVILSQIFKGFAVVLDTQTAVDSKLLPPHSKRHGNRVQRGYQTQRRHNPHRNQGYSGIGNRAC